MGWGRAMLLGNVGIRLDLDDMELDIQEIVEVVSKNIEDDSEQFRRIQGLEKDVLELKLYLTTLLKTLVSKGILQPEELEKFVEVIDSD